MSAMSTFVLILSQNQNVNIINMNKTLVLLILGKLFNFVTSSETIKNFPFFRDL